MGVIIAGATLLNAQMQVVADAINAGSAGQIKYYTSQATQTLTAASWASSIATFTKASHGYAVGDYIEIAGVTPSGYNGRYVILSVATNTFAVALTTNPGGAGSVFGTCARLLAASGTLGTRTLLATQTCSDPAQASVSGGVLTFDTITPESDAPAGGVAKMARIVDSTGATVIDVSVGGTGSGEIIELDNTTIVQHDTVSLSSFTLTRPVTDVV